MTLSICTAQLNFVVGDMPGNARKIIEAARTAHAPPPYSWTVVRTYSPGVNSTAPTASEIDAFLAAQG